MIGRITRWAEAREDVRAAMLVGSRVRDDHPADELSDIDIILLVRDPKVLLSDSTWPRELGDVALTFVEQTPIPGVRERRVLFGDGTDVDFVAAPAERVAELREAGSDVLVRGFRVLVDKDDLTAALADVGPRTADGPPTERAVAEAVSDFWYHAVWTARKLRRGEVLVAKECLDGYMKDIVVRVTAWHAEGRDTWHGARFFEEWADSRVVGSLGAAYATYDAADVARALDATMSLFAWLARETTEQLSLPYAEREEEVARRLVQTVLAG